MVIIFNELKDNSINKSVVAFSWSLEPRGLKNVLGYRGRSWSER